MSGARRDRRDLDEDDVRTRPGRGSRPRTRDRPEHADAVDAVVVGVDRGRYTCRLTGPERRAAGPAKPRGGGPAKRAPASWDPAGVLIEAIRGGDLRRTP